MNELYLISCALSLSKQFKYSFSKASLTRQDKESMLNMMFYHFHLESFILKYKTGSSRDETGQTI